MAKRKEVSLGFGKKNKKSAWMTFKQNRFLLLLSLPALLYVTIMSYIPMPGIVLAFKKFNYAKGIFGSDWVGFDNFGFLFHSGDLFRLTFNTIAYNVVFMITGMIAQIAAAVILSEIRGKYFKKVSQTLLLLPYFLTWVVVGAICYNIFGSYGVINGFITAGGGEKIAFMNMPNIWPVLFIIFNIWKGLGYGAVVYLAAITGLDQEMFEAAEIDGANVWQRVWHLTIPCIKPTVIVMVLLNLSRVMQGNFQMFYNLTGNNPLLYKTTDILDTYVYRALMSTQNFSVSGAVGLYQGVVGFVIIVVFNQIIRKLSPENALF